MERRRFPLHSNINLRRLYFHRCLSVHRGVGVCPKACWDTHPPLPRQVPFWQVHPLAGTPLPLGRYTPGRYLPPSRYTPLRSACWNMVNKRAVCIPLECILVDVIVIVVIFCSYIRNLHSGEKKTPTDSGQGHQKSPAAKPKRPYPLQNRSPYTAKFRRLQVNRIHEL